MNEKLTILVTNDDGVDAQGIHFLTQEMQKYGDVYVVAPQFHQSGMAHAITFQVPLRAKCLRNEDSLHIYSVNGTPVDCVKFALDQLLKGKKVDLLVAGINHGPNSANSTIYSGTVACAREGAINRIPSIAFSSLDFSEKINFEPYSKYIHSIVDYACSQTLDTHVFLNVNFPKPNDKIVGMRVCHQTKGLWIERFIAEKDPRNSTCYWLTGEYHNEEPTDTQNDEWCLAHGFVAIVPIKVETTDEQSILKLNQLNC